ncbi:MAG: hypothetical protein IAE80_08250 [Anaerolinea sp.]|nr:hypothetical protein [Anaerolinea sp.]
MLQTERDMLLMEQRKRELLRKARIQQLYREVERIPMGVRLMNLIGDLMITNGQRLKLRANMNAGRVDGRLTVRTVYKP